MSNGVNPLHKLGTRATKDENVGCSPWDPRCSTANTKNVYVAIDQNKNSKTFDDFLDAKDYLLSEGGDYIGSIHRLKSVIVF